LHLYTSKTNSSLYTFVPLFLSLPTKHFYLSICFLFLLPFFAPSSPLAAIHDELFTISYCRHSYSSREISSTSPRFLIPWIRFLLEISTTRRLAFSLKLDRHGPTSADTSSS
jgi:hypothetical protein